MDFYVGGFLKIKTIELRPFRLIISLIKGFFLGNYYFFKFYFLFVVLSCLPENAHLMLLNYFNFIYLQYV